jgi:hypothetical protein
MKTVSAESLVLGSVMGDYVAGHEDAGIVNVEGLEGFSDLADELADDVKAAMSAGAAATAAVTPTGSTSIVDKFVEKVWRPFRDSKMYWPVMIGVPVIGLLYVAGRSATKGRLLPKFSGMTVSGAQDVSAMSGFGGDQKSRFGEASAACRASGVRPFTKEFGKCMKREMGTE